MSVSCEFHAISKLYHEVFSLPPGKSQYLSLNEGLMNAKVIIPGILSIYTLNGWIYSLSGSAFCLSL